jgi:hypothetical protein
LDGRNEVVKVALSDSEGLSEGAKVEGESVAGSVAVGNGLDSEGDGEDVEEGEGV